MTTQARQSTELRQAEIIATMLHLAAERNPADITTTDIAKAMRVTQGALFRHFATKEAIRLAVVEWIEAQLLGALLGRQTGHRHTQQVDLPSERQQTRQGLEQRGLTCAVRPDDAGPAARGQVQINVMEYLNISEASPYGTGTNSYFLHSYNPTEERVPRCISHSR